MRRAFSTEVAGWLEAFSEPGILRALLVRVLLVTLSAAAGAVGAVYASPLVVVLVAALVTLVASLVVLRVTGRP